MQKDQSDHDINEILRELEEYRLKVQDQEKENDGLRDRVALMEKAHQGNLEEMRIHYEYMKKSQNDREMKETNMKYLSEKMNFEG